MPTSLDAARRERRSVELAGLEPTSGSSYVAASDVVALLNRVGECVRALPVLRAHPHPDVGRRGQAHAVGDQHLQPVGLAENDELRAVLARLDVTRSALRVTALSGAQRIAAVRWLGQRVADDDPAAAGDHGRPAHTYVICNGQVIRQPGDPGEGAGDETHASREERIDDLARAGALIAAEIDRLQHDEQRRYA